MNKLLLILLTILLPLNAWAGIAGTTVTLQSADFDTTCNNGVIERQFVGVCPSSWSAGTLSSGGGDWQLSASNYVAAKMPMNLVYPLPAAASWDYSKNAYPGIKWTLGIGIQGGAWPFKYEIISDGGATGLTIGSELNRSTDVATGLTLHTLYDGYGQLTWSNPVAGTYNISVRVTDQEGSTVDVAIPLTVGTTGWVFIDPVNGNDTNAGTLAAPLQTPYPLHNGSMTHTAFANHRVYLRSGEHEFDGFTPTNNFRIEPGYAPAQYIGYPDESARISLTTGWFILWNNVADVLFKDLTMGYADTFNPTGDLYHIVEFGASPRVTLYNMTFDRFTGTANGLENSAIYYSAGDHSNYRYVAKSAVTGPSGHFLQMYEWENFLIEDIDILSSDTSAHDASSHAIFYNKYAPVTGTYRNIRAVPSVSGSNTIIVNPNSRNGRVGRNVEVTYSTINNPDNRAIGFGVNEGDSDVGHTGFFAYRNSLNDSLNLLLDQFTWANSDDVQIDNNALTNGTITPASYSAESNNQLNVTFDSNMKLSGTSRTNFLGTVGAEVAE